MLLHLREPHLLLLLQNKANCFQLAKRPKIMVSLIQGSLICVLIY